MRTFASLECFQALGHLKVSSGTHGSMTTLVLESLDVSFTRSNRGAPVLRESSCA